MSPSLSQVNNSVKRETQSGTLMLGIRDILNDEGMPINKDKHSQSNGCGQEDDKK